MKKRCSRASMQAVNIKRVFYASFVDNAASNSVTSHFKIKINQKTTHFLHMPCCQNLSARAANLSESSQQLPQKLSILYNNPGSDTFRQLKLSYKIINLNQHTAKFQSLLQCTSLRISLEFKEETKSPVEKSWALSKDSYQHTYRVI